MRENWRGQTVVILGGGKSLTGAALRQIAQARLAGRCKVIAVNDAVYLAWWADWLHAADAAWWHRHIHFVHLFHGIRSSVDELPEMWRVRRYELTGKAGFDKRRGRCRGTNGGYQALHCAVQADAARVVLVGFDMQGGHWHDATAAPAADFASVMLPHFKSLRRTLNARGVEVLNCSPGSALTCFPMADLGRALAPTGTRIGAAKPAQ